MTGGAHSSVGCREGRRRRGWRRFPVWKAATGWGATDAQDGREGKMKWAMVGPKVQMGRLAAGPVGPKVRKILFRIKFDF
jgi:hypothetical protein